MDSGNDDLWSWLRLVMMGHGHLSWRTTFPHPKLCFLSHMAMLGTCHLHKGEPSCWMAIVKSGKKDSILFMIVHEHCVFIWEWLSDKLRVSAMRCFDANEKGRSQLAHLVRDKSIKCIVLCGMLLGVWKSRKGSFRYQRRNIDWRVLSPRIWHVGPRQSCDSMVVWRTPKCTHLTECIRFAIELVICWYMWELYSANFRQTRRNVRTSSVPLGGAWESTCAHLVVVGRIVVR